MKYDGNNPLNVTSEPHPFELFEWWSMLVYGQQTLICTAKCDLFLNIDSIAIYAPCPDGILVIVAVIFYGF